MRGLSFLLVGPMSLEFCEAASATEGRQSNGCMSAFPAL